MSRAQKIVLVAGVQIVVLLCIVGFGQWTVWTADTVQLRVSSVTDPQRLGEANPPVGYEVAKLDAEAIVIDVRRSADERSFYGDAYIELQRETDGAWSAIAVHDGRRRVADGTVLIDGYLTLYRGPGGWEATVMYGEAADVYASRSTLARMPSGPGHDIRVELRVNRYGSATPLRFIIDGEPYPLERR